MADVKLNVRLQLRSDTLANWEASTVVLLAGEFAYATDVKKFKIGDGVSTWSQLAYVSADWDSIKPTGGIPKADLAAAVQASLNKADTALQSHQTITITEGTTEGTISVKIGSAAAVEVPVHGFSTLRTDVDENAGSISALEADVSTIESKIPTEATSTNKLVDTTTMTNFVNSSIQANAADFVTPAADGGQFTSFTALQTGPWYKGGTAVAQSDLHKSDYAIFIKTSNGAEEQWRAVYSGTEWEEQYKVGSALTAAQQAAIDSGITATKVAAISTNTTNIAANTTAITKAQSDATAAATAVTTLQTNVTNGTVVAGKASADAEGNVITDTYATKTEVTTGLAAKQNTIANVTDTAVAGQYVSAVSQTSGKITVTRAALPTVTIPVTEVKGVTGDAVTVTTADGVVTVQHDAYSTGTITANADEPYMIQSLTVDQGHVTSAAAQSLSAALAALGTLTLDGGTATA